MNLAYFITAHGYGHGVRSCIIGDALAKNHKITFRTDLPIELFNEELKSPFSYKKGVFDCGCLQKNGVTTDVDATINKYIEIAQKNRTLLEKEVDWCRMAGIEGIISDITPFAFEIARKCNLPSIAISNFTWYDIYEEYLSDYSVFQEYLDEIHNQYRAADLLLALQPAQNMQYFKRQLSIPLIGRVGKNKRDAINTMFSIMPEKKLGLIYTGNFGMDSAVWKDLEKLTEWEFLGVYDLPCNVDNFHLVSKKDFRYQDLIASSDVMISKLGYGAISECMLNGKPLIYLPRTKFAEYATLERAVRGWGGGFCITEEEYFSLQWEKALTITMGKKVKKIVSNGVDQCVNHINSLFYKN
jgi:L-arabinokinase